MYQNLFIQPLNDNKMISNIVYFGMRTIDSPLIAAMFPCSGSVTSVLQVNNFPIRLSSTLITSICTRTLAIEVSPNDNN